MRWRWPWRRQAVESLWAVPMDVVTYARSPEAEADWPTIEWAAAFDAPTGGQMIGMFFPCAECGQSILCMFDPVTGGAENPKDCTQHQEAHDASDG